MKKVIYSLVCLVVLYSCSSSSSDDSPEALLEVTAELMYFIYTPDTGNNTSSLEYQIRFTNPNNVPITGFSRITMNSDGMVFTRLGTNHSQCYTIEANSDCLYSFEAEDSHDLGYANSVEFVSAEYNISLE